MSGGEKRIIHSLSDLTKKLYEQMKDGKQLELLIDLLKEYQGTDWKKHVRYNSDKYHRILIYKTGYFDLFIICWKKGQRTKIHDSPYKGCLIKVLEGKLYESLYNNSSDENPLHPLGGFIRTDELEKEKIIYQKGETILHQIMASVDSVSLHIHSPQGYEPQYYEITLEPGKIN